MFSVILNYWAIIVAAVATMVIGYIWYMMPVFGRTWMQLIGKQEADLKKAAGPAMGFMVVLSLLTAYILAHFVVYANASTWMDGAITGFWAWLGFGFTTIASMNIYAQRPWKLTFIDAGYRLVSLVVMGGILAAWK